ncbi:MAG: Protein of unknown function (DUF1444) [Phormidesmis priestleyi Ana]|uniref:Uncharacterized protein n=1 Tax=Phormidesmis priestleyi Ana TaxID=1666911 RepID=A0A0P7YW47_9CYAN|nr:MAG: Protein of unknown function (DUF1444) [Phormidesmis priestleyi Ana]
MSEMSALKRAEEPMYASVKTATATSATMDRQRLGDHLVEAGLVNDVQLHYALAEQKTVPLRLGELLVRNGWLTQQTVEFFVARLCLTSTAR